MSEELDEIATAYICAFAMPKSYAKGVVLEYLGGRILAVARQHCTTRGKLQYDYECIRIINTDGEEAYRDAHGQVILLLLPFARSVNLKLAYQMAHFAFQQLPQKSHAKATAERALKDLNRLMHRKTSRITGTLSRPQTGCLDQIAKWITKHETMAKSGLT